MNAQQLNWNDFEYVLAVCQTGSLSGAARKLDVNHSTVFRRINAIEEMLGVRLFERLSNGYAMTEAGEAVFETGERVENEILGLSSLLVGKDLRLSGILRVTAPDALAVKILMPLIAEFSRDYPGIEIALSVSSDYVNLSQREADVAVRATPSPPETLVGRRICSMATSIYGSTTYLRDKPDCINDDSVWLMPDEDLPHLPVTKWKNKHYPNNRITLRSNSFLSLFEATKQSQGISPLPCFLADKEKDLQRCIAPPNELNSEVWVLSHPNLRKTARVRAFTDFLVTALEKESDLLEGQFSG